jgi:hypothetical protein
MNLRLLLVVLIACRALQAQTSVTDWNIARPGVKEVQVPIAFLKITAKFKVGRRPDWILVSGDTVWFATSSPNILQRIEVAEGKEIWFWGDSTMSNFQILASRNRLFGHRSSLSS